MDDKLRAIEMETAKLRLARERLAFKRETESQRLREQATQIGGVAIDTTRKVGGGLWALVKFLFVLVMGGVMGMLALLAFAAFQAAKSDSPSGNFEYRFGAYMGGVSEWVYPVVIVVGMIWFAVKVYGKK
jgi:hypothetical protein